ncbi:hypothetical protein SPRG_12142 [Saprolegnia parasitica CBS 223.65]|uniref:Uncharacterized protein n=1 Tax=Saprolegnia parasitica (strain CBS 223.65) TaxID=695850 RepID=A0A067C680_SAPPC|nr:hypothetical protein SPRG_12142 [Saprolegnia parasitica CBS 223.65]KDO22302.1 hypothetical protein SPRG_12142 [Saprolegnia parasitica CBS 223.65]|eukprot:XP_012207035.1 hypothetical protein SPRG_12142 [Saprolegnia parasitica CBS 223.65]
MGARVKIALAWHHKAQFLKDLCCEHKAFRGMLATIKGEPPRQSCPATATASSLGFAFIVVDLLADLVDMDQDDIGGLDRSVQRATGASGISVASLTTNNATQRPSRRSRDLYRQHRGDHRPETLASQVRVVYAMGRQSKPRTEWEPLLTATIAAQVAVLCDDHEDMLASSFYHGDLLLSLGEYASVLVIVL